MPQDITNMLGNEEEIQAKGSETPDLQMQEATPLDKMNNMATVPDKTDKQQEQTTEPSELEGLNSAINFKQEKKRKEAGDLDQNVLINMLMTGDNSDGMFSPDNKTEDENRTKLFEEQNESVKVKIKTTANGVGKYEQHFKRKMLEDPENYTIDTPKGKMSIAKAMRMGYNPITRVFKRELSQNILKQKYRSKLDDNDKIAFDKVFSEQQNKQEATSDMQPMQAAQVQLPEEETQPTSPVASQQAVPVPVQDQTQPVGIEAALGGNQ